MRYDNKSNVQCIPWLVALGISVVLMSMNIFTSSLPTMLVELSTSESELQWTLSIHSLGCCLASLLVGPLSDHYGRKIITLLSLVLFSVSSLGCAISPTLFALDCWRLIQGVSTAAIPIVGLAILSDLFHGRRFAAIFAYIGVVVALSFLVTHLVGGYVGEHYGWRVLFYAMFVSGVILLFLYKTFLPETMNNPLSIRCAANNYKKMFKDHIFLLYCVMVSAMLAGFYAYIGASSYLYIEQFALSKVEFGMITSFGMVANVLAYLIVGSLTKWAGPRKILLIGIYILAAASTALGWLTFLGTGSAYVLLFPMLLYNLAIGFIFPSANSIAFERFRNMAGSTSAFLTSFRMLFIAIGSYISGYVYNGTLFSITIVIISCSIVTIISFFIVALKLKGPPKTQG